MNSRRFPALLWNSVLVALVAASAPVRAQSDAAPLPVGMNLRPVTPYDRAWVFADAMKLASPWRYLDAAPRKGMLREPERDDDEAVPVDACGWPLPERGRPIACQVFVSMPGRFPGGEYVCTWKGSGRVELRGAGKIASRGEQRVVLAVDPSAGGALELQLHDVDPGNPPTDVRLWLPGLEGSSSSFHPRFLERLRPFSVLRFYPWMRVYTTSARWERRSTLAMARQSTPEGVAVEYMLELCNELGADPWFCMPHTADDDYVRRFAGLVRDTLVPGRRVYVEFSNEVWNTDYAAGRWARAEAERRGVPTAQVTAEGAARVFDLWREVFGEQRERLVRVVGAQLHDPRIARSIARHLDGDLDAIAVGAYFAVRADRDDVGRATSATDLLTHARANVRELVLPRIAEHRALADSLSQELGRPIALLAYEGGQSIVARSPGGGLSLEATLACQDLPEMFTVYRELLDGARERGLELFVGYDFVGARSSADTFSVLEYLEQPLDHAPKYRALVQGWENRNALQR